MFEFIQDCWPLKSLFVCFFLIEFVYIFVLGYPPCGCGSLHNSEDVEGQIVLLERGECSFTSKALKAQEAGAAAAIITVSQLFGYFFCLQFFVYIFSGTKSRQ